MGRLSTSPYLPRTGHPRLLFPLPVKRRTPLSTLVLLVLLVLPSLLFFPSAFKTAANPPFPPVRPSGPRNYCFVSASQTHPLFPKGPQPPPHTSPSSTSLSLSLPLSAIHHYYQLRDTINPTLVALPPLPLPPPPPLLSSHRYLETPKTPPSPPLFSCFRLRCLLLHNDLLTLSFRGRPSFFRSTSLTRSLPATVQLDHCLSFFRLLPNPTEPFAPFCFVQRFETLFPPSLIVSCQTRCCAVQKLVLTTTLASPIESVVVSRCKHCLPVSHRLFV